MWSLLKSTDNRPTIRLNRPIRRTASSLSPMNLSTIYRHSSAIYRRSALYRAQMSGISIAEEIVNQSLTVIWESLTPAPGGMAAVSLRLSVPLVLVYRPLVTSEDVSIIHLCVRGWAL